MSIGATIKNGEAFRVSDEAGSSVNRDGSRAAVVVAADVAPLSSTNTNIVRSGESVQEDQLAARATSALRRRTGNTYRNAGATTGTASTGDRLLGEGSRMAATPAALMQLISLSLAHSLPSRRATRCFQEGRGRSADGSGSFSQVTNPSYFSPLNIQEYDRPFTYPLVRKRIPGIDGSTKGSKNKSTLERAAGITPRSGKGGFGVNRCHYQNSASQTGRPLVPMCTSLAGSIPQEVPKRPRIGGFGVNRCHYQNSASQSVSGNDRNCAKISVSDQRWRVVPSRSVAYGGAAASFRAPQHCWSEIQG